MNKIFPEILIIVCVRPEKYQQAKHVLIDLSYVTCSYALLPASISRIIRIDVNILMDDGDWLTRV